jgi:inner membrane protein
VSIAPDIDGAGLLLDFFGPHQVQTLEWWSKYHHILGHNMGFGLFLTITAFALAKRRWLVSFLVMVSFHLHLVGDLLGSKGSDGYQWPIPYLLPFSDAWQWIWAGQWQLNAWPNFVVTGVVALHMFYIAWKKGVSPLEIISSKANASFVDTLRRRFGLPNEKSA